MRILAVDHGSKRIGLALSDPSGTIANPLAVILHRSRVEDAVLVADKANTYEAELIVVGCSLSEDGQPNYEGRSAIRFSSTLRKQVPIPVVLWDESLTTQAARAARIEMDVSRRKRMGHLDDFAATVLLQSYLDSRSKEK